MPIPTLAQFKALTGRSGVGRVFKTKSDMRDLMEALKWVNNSAGSPPAKLGAVRQLRRCCIAWIQANVGKVRASSAAINTLLADANAEFIVLTNGIYAGSQASSNNPVPIKSVPNLAFGKQLTGKDVGRIGNQLDGGLAKETQARHWGPSVAGQMQQRYQQYQAGGGTLSIGAFADKVYLINMEDDPSGVYLGVSQANVNIPAVKDGVKYCTETERKSYALDIRGGRLHDASGNLYDTSSRETHFSGHGWAIFVLGFDNVLYSNTHLVNIFHHSSFFAGEPVQCGGEICCIAGKVRYMTNKTGHYKSGKLEFYRLLSFLSYHGVDLTNALAAPDIRTAPDYFRASDVFGAHGSRPSGVPVRTSSPAKLTLPGVPAWPVPPMTA